jgi:PAS domain S-box-containing protein
VAVAVVRPAHASDCYFISLIEDINAYKQSELRLRDNEFLYRRMFADSPQPMWVGDRETQMFIDVNAAAIAHYGYTREEFLSFHLTDIRAPERRNDPMQALLPPQEGEMVRTFPRRHRRKDGSEIDVMISVQWIDYNGRPAIVVVVNDVTAIVQAEQRMRRLNAELEQRVAERTAKLEIANKELADFSYSVAHDLRSPLRSMHGFGMLLIENEAAGMSEEGRDHLRRIVRSSEMMAELIDDLLEYARVEREPLAAASLDLRQLCLEVVGSRLEDNAAEQVSITVDVPAGDVLASRRALIVALRNLIDNAVKFSQGQDTPRVEIGGTLADGTWTLWVRDNGIGFDMAYHVKIFDMFQRLHRSDAYSGTGIGLALVRKAMQRMGGSVWAYSTPGAGATFYLRLPAA